MKKQAILLCLILIGAFFASGCTDDIKENNTTTTNETTTPDAGVIIKNYLFVPNNITITQGQTVQWTNRDSIIYDVTFDSFNSTKLNKYGTYSHTFDEAGTFEYHSSLYPTMRGTVIVKEI